MDRNNQTKAVVSSEGFFGPAEVFCNGLFPSFPRKFDAQESRTLDRKVIEILERLTRHFRVRIVVYLRRQDEHFNSLYSFYLHGHITEATPNPKDFLRANPHEYDYFGTLELWSHYFGKENVQPFIFDATLNRTGLVHHFASRVLDISAADGEIEEIRVNEHRPSSLQRFVNELSMGWPKDKYSLGNVFQFYDTCDIDASGGEDEPFLDADTERALMQRVAMSNEELGRVYFHTDGSPFADYARKGSAGSVSQGATCMRLCQTLALQYESKLDRLSETARQGEIRIQALEGRLRLAHERLAHCLSELKSVQIERDGIRNSTSWKITAPLRRFKQVVTFRRQGS